MLVWGVGAAVYAQSSEGAGTIQEIKPVIRTLTIERGDKVYLSVIVIGPNGTEDRGLASGVNLIWTASGGDLEVDDDTTRALFVAPRDIGIGTYTVTASAGSECVGEAADCNATFTIRVWHLCCPLPPHVLAENPPGEIPTALEDDEGNQYAVFTPEEGGTFTDEDFSVSAGIGAVPNDEIIGVRMSQLGPVANAGMSHHHYTLRGNQYTISIVDAEARPIVSYALSRDVEVCVPVPDEFRPIITSIVMVAKNTNGTLTPMSSSVQISSSSLIVCGYTSTLPATVAVGVPSTPQPSLEPEPGEVLPATGGTSPTSPLVMVWALLIGVVLIAASSIALAKRRQEPPTL